MRETERKIETALKVWFESEGWGISQLSPDLFARAGREEVNISALARRPVRWTSDHAMMTEFIDGKCIAATEVRYNIVQRLVHRWWWYPRSEWYIESDLGSIGPFRSWTEANGVLMDGWGVKPSLIMCDKRYAESAMYEATAGGVQCPPK